MTNGLMVVVYSLQRLAQYARLISGVSGNCRLQRFKAMQIRRVMFSNRLCGRRGAIWWMGEEVVSW